MSTPKTVQAIRDAVERRGYCVIPFETASRVLGISPIDENDFEDAIENLVNSTTWLSSYHIAWVPCHIRVEGPYDEPGGP